MSGTLVLAEHLNGRLRDVTRELVTAAQELPGPVAVEAVGHHPVITGEGPHLAHRGLA